MFFILFFLPKMKKQSPHYFHTLLISRIHPLKFQLFVRERHLLVQAVALLLLVRDVHGDRTTAEEHPHIAVLWGRK